MNDADRLAHQVMDKAPALVLYARQWLDAASAEDVVQEALTALLMQRRRPDDPVAWMYRAVHNAAMNQSRSMTRRKRREQTVAAVRREWFESAGDSPIDGELARQVLQRLPDEQRRIVIMRIWGGMKLEEIARITQSSPSTVHDRYVRALEELRSALEEPCRKKSK